jgi:hypothetical protein
MHIIPYITFGVVTSDPPNAAIQRLSKQVDQSSWFPSLPYAGKVREAGFKILPVTWYRNSFMPVIMGEFEPGPAGGTIVYVTMRMNSVVAVFTCVWCAFVGRGLVAVVESAIEGSASWPVVLVPLLMLLFAAALALGCFWYEVPQRREDITIVLVGPSGAPREKEVR